jgi:hypothetical protein
VRSALLAIPLLCAACAATPPPVLPSSLLLNNTDPGPTTVEVVLTASPYCTWRGPGFVSRQFFVMPQNSTRFIEAPAGTDVCWRHKVIEANGSAYWLNWDIAYTYPGRSLASNL